MAGALKGKWRWRSGEEWLESGRFVSDWSKAASRETDWTGLKLLLAGIEPACIGMRFALPQK